MPKSVLSEAQSGDRLRALVALRDRLAGAIDDCTDAAELSSLGLRFQRTLEQIEDLGGKAAGDETDALAARRAAKLSAATGS